MAGGKAQWATFESQFEAILSDAARRYKDESSGSLNDFLTPPMRTVDDLKRQLELQNGRFSHFREKRHSIFGALAAAMKPIEVIGEVASGASEEIFPPGQTIFSAVSYLINAAENVSSAYDSIVELFGQLKDFTERLNVYVQHQLSSALREKLVSILACLFEVLVVATKEIRKGRFKAYFKQVFGSGSPIQPAMEKLKILTQGEERQVIAETFGGVSQINTKTDRIEELVNKVNENVLILSENRERINAFHQDKLKEILDPSPYPEDFFNSFNKSRVQDTGDWILEDQGLQSWLKGDTRYLWICGGVGTGKSYLTTRIVSWGMEDLSHLAYFYFRANNPETRSVRQALRDVAYQLSESDAFYAQQLLNDLHSPDDIQTIPSAFRKLLINPFKEDKREKMLHIFLDGIDEAEPDEIEELLEQFASLDDAEGPANCKVQVALTGRSYLSEAVTFGLDPDALGSQVLTTLHITPERNAKDVHSFIVEGVFQSRNLSRTSVEFKYEVIATMEKQVGGLFILAKFMLEEIARKRHPRSVLSSLKSFPKEINGMLMRSLSDLAATMSDEEAGDLNEMLTWVTCAEEALTLGQLEAVMILRFGDSPFRLEETLRNQFACFFELEREDGLTTNDLIQEHERQHRLQQKENKRRSISPISPLGPASMALKKASTQPIPSRPTTPNNRLSPGGTRHYSPGGSPDSFTLNKEIEYRSNKATTYINFFHTSVKEFFSSDDTKSLTTNESGPRVGVDPMVARIHVLTTCLRIFVDKAWFEKHDLGFGKEPIKQYAAWYWQEEVSAIDPAKVPVAEKKKLAPWIYQMLTDEATLLDWSVMYEKNDEGLEVLTDNNIKGLQRWLSDADMLAALDAKARAWVTKGMTQSPGIFEPLGRLYAKAWVGDFMYLPTAFCFKIVQNMAFMQEGYAWSHAGSHWSEIPVDQRIPKAIEWASFPETAHWHRRVGSTYLVYGLHNKALSHYDRALQLDNNSVETSGRIAYCLWRDRRYEEALKKTLECEVIEENNIKSGKLSAEELSSTKWRLYRDHFLIGQCYFSLGKVNEALDYHRKAITSSRDAGLKRSEYFEAEIRYLEILANEGRHEQIMAFLRELDGQVLHTKYGKSRLVDFIIDQAKRSLLIDWIPRAASKVDETDFLIDSLELALDVAGTIRDTLRILYLRLALGATFAYSRNRDAAIIVFEQLSLFEYRPKGNIPTRQGYALSFQRLAILYKEKALDAGLTSPDAQAWLMKLEHIQDKQDRHQNQDLPSGLIGSDFNLSAIYLALFYRRLGRAQQAQALLGALITESLAILSDDDPQNDEYGLDNLLCLLIAADDVENARGLAQSMRKTNPDAHLMTPAESPVAQRAAPKLPEVQAVDRGCAQCLEHISPAQEFYFCQLCLESFCLKCWKETKKEGNATKDHRADMLCRSDHEWFAVPPRNRVLLRGEILIGDGVVNFTEWKAGLQKKWGGAGVGAGAGAGAVKS